MGARVARRTNERTKEEGVVKDVRSFRLAVRIQSLVTASCLDLAVTGCDLMSLDTGSDGGTGFGDACIYVTLIHLLLNE